MTAFKSTHNFEQKNPKIGDNSERNDTKYL